MTGPLHRLPRSCQTAGRPLNPWATFVARRMKVPLPAAHPDKTAGQLPSRPGKRTSFTGHWGVSHIKRSRSVAYQLELGTLSPGLERWSKRYSGVVS
jgi:hypothetical protein